MVTQITSPLDRTGRLTINARLPRTVRGRHSPLHPREGTRHAKPARHRPDSAVELDPPDRLGLDLGRDRKSTRLNSSHTVISYAVFCLKKKNKDNKHRGQACKVLDLERNIEHVLERHQQMDVAQRVTASAVLLIGHLADQYRTHGKLQC